MRTEKFFQTMRDGTEISVNRWLPDSDEDIKAVIVLSHGMLEHSLRYDRVGSELAEKGYVFNAHDHRGHGRTAFNAEQKGTGEFFVLAKKDGFNAVEGDLEEIIKRVSSDYPNKKIILLGHSFGSFISQAYIERNEGLISACVLCGTAGPQNASANLGLCVANCISLFHKYNYKSKGLQKLVFNGYCKKVPEAKTGFEWLSKSQANIDMYLNDSWCGGIASLEFFRDLFGGLKNIHKKSNMKKVPKNLPVFFIAGDEDPVGSYGKTIVKLSEIYKKNGVSDVDVKLYNGYRHEIFNEEISSEVIEDVDSWIKKHL